MYPLYFWESDTFSIHPQFHRADPRAMDRYRRCRTWEGALQAIGKGIWLGPRVLAESSALFSQRSTARVAETSERGFHRNGQRTLDLGATAPLRRTVGSASVDGRRRFASRRSHHLTT